MLVLSVAACLAALCVPAASTASVERACTPGVDPSRLQVLTWNLDADRGQLGRLTEDLVAGRLLGVPGQHHLVLLQEVTAASVHAVAARLGWSAFFAPVRTDLDPPRGNAVLSSGALHDTRAIALPQERQPRGAVAGGIEIGGRRLFVASTHFENRSSWWRGGPFIEAGRARQAAALLKELPGDHGIVGGDINTLLGASEPALTVLLRRFPDTPPGPWTPTFRGRLTLDHVFFDLPDGWTVRRAVVAERYGSDHHPVAGLVDVEARPSAACS